MKPYVPDPLPLKCLDVGRLIKRVGTANAAIARYDGLLQSVVNPSVMLSPLTQREAVLSSRIEGTQATVDEVVVMSKVAGTFQVPSAIPRHSPQPPIPCEPSKRADGTRSVPATMPHGPDLRSRHWQDRRAWLCIEE